VRVFLALVLGIALGAAGLWYFSSTQGKTNVQSASREVESAAKSASDAVQDKVRELDLSPQKIKDELARSGHVVRQKAQEAGQAINDATLDARITTAIKAKFVTSRDLPSLSISVNTTAGVVTLSGMVNSADDIGKAMVLAMGTDGVRQVISTLQIKPQPKPAPAT
jgi:hyperosmotically inducible periplasmic protein